MESVDFFALPSLVTLRLGRVLCIYGVLIIFLRLEVTYIKKFLLRSSSVPSAIYCSLALKYATTASIHVAAESQFTVILPCRTK